MQAIDEKKPPVDEAGGFQGFVAALSTSKLTAKKTMMKEDVAKGDLTECSLP
jgi:hypothetical protein